MICVHLLVPLTLMRNLEEFTEKARWTPANQSFKEDPTPRRMHNFVLDSITKKRRPVPGASIWDTAEEDDTDSSSSSSGSSSSSQALGDKSQPWKKAAAQTQKQPNAPAGKAKKPCQDSRKSNSTPANDKGKAKPDSKAKEAAKKKQKPAACQNGEDDV